ncbi:MAG TPA: flagellar motor protein MotB [Lacipirellula sp.]
MAGAGGGAWKVAYADFVTAMMAFFMVMWLTTQKKEVKEAVAGYFREPFATYKSTQKGAAATAKPVTDPMYGHTAQPQKRRLAISGDDTDYQFTVLFPVDDALLDAEQLEAIKGFAPMMKGKLNRIEVRGHCLRRPLPKGSPYKNHWELCYARSQVVKEALEAEGIEPERIRLSQAEGNEPLALNLAEEELKLNSRVDVILLPDLADIPWARPRKVQESQSKEGPDPHTAADADPAAPQAEAPHDAAAHGTDKAQDDHSPVEHGTHATVGEHAEGGGHAEH